MTYSVNAFGKDSSVRRSLPTFDRIVVIEAPLGCGNFTHIKETALLPLSHVDTLHRLLFSESASRDSDTRLFGARTQRPIPRFVTGGRLSELPFGMRKPDIESA